MKLNDRLVSQIYFGVVMEMKKEKSSLSRSEQSELRKKAITQAALAEFSQKGFAAARMEDIAKKAHVAKGTVYLHFADKESLFEEIVKTHIFPMLSTLETEMDLSLPLKAQVTQLILSFSNRLTNPDVANIIKLLISEGSRFPHLSDMYYRLVVKRGLSALTKVFQAQAEKDPNDQAAKILAEFPQLLIAPAITGMIWHSLFATQHPLDIQKMLYSYLDLITLIEEKELANEKCTDQ